MELFHALQYEFLEPFVGDEQQVRDQARRAATRAW
jgi:hypothetical protein